LYINLSSFKIQITNLVIVIGGKISGNLGKNCFIFDLESSNLKIAIVTKSSYYKYRPDENSLDGSASSSYSSGSRRKSRSNHSYVDAFHNSTAKIIQQKVITYKDYCLRKSCDSSEINGGQNLVSWRGDSSIK